MDKAFSEICCQNEKASCAVAFLMGFWRRCNIGKNNTRIISKSNISNINNISNIINNDNNKINNRDRIVKISGRCNICKVIGDISSIISLSPFLSLSLSVSHTLSLPIYISIYLSIYLSIHIHVFVSLFLSRSISLSLSLTLSLSFPLSLSISLSLFHRNATTGTYRKLVKSRARTP